MTDNLLFQGFGMPDIPMNLGVSAQLPEGVTYVQKFGINPLVTTASTPEDIWESGGNYQFSANGVADIVSLSSSSAADDMPVLVIGLDITGAEVFQIITLDGTTRVNLTTPLWRVYRMENMTQTGQSMAGTVYCYAGTEETDGVPDGASVVKAIIDNGNNQTQMAISTVPLGKVAFLRRAEVGFGASGGPSAGPEQVQFCFKIRTLGNVFKVKKTVYCISFGMSHHYDERPFPDPIPALTDIKVCVEGVSDSISAHSTYHLWLMDQELLTQEMLDSINQPTSML